MKNVFSRIYLTVLLLVCGMVGYAQNADIQHVEKRYNIYFRVNSTVIENDFSSNSSTIETLRQDVSETLQMKGAELDSLIIISSASPEGSLEYNRHLAMTRASNTKKLILSMFPELKDMTVKVECLDEDWDGLFDIINAHSEFPQREEMMQIIQSNSSLHSKELQLKELEQGWTYFLNNYAHSLRNSSITISVAIKGFAGDPLPVVSYSYIPEFKAIDKSMARVEVEPANPFSQKHLYVKTNALGLGLAISNLGCEIDFTKHLSISIPVYYSALNYLKETIKFRTLAVQPEIRYWTNKDNNGLFLGIHGGVAQYNIAVDGDLRYQDHNGTSPAIGGGIGLGYRLPISDDNRWHIEFAIGAGVYKLHYDTFYNVENGKLLDTYQKTYWGIDNAAINISYRFDLKKRKK